MEDEVEGQVEFLREPVPLCYLVMITNISNIRLNIPMVDGNALRHSCAARSKHQVGNRIPFDISPKAVRPGLGNVTSENKEMIRTLGRNRGYVLNVRNNYG